MKEALRPLSSGDQVAIISTGYWSSDEMLDGAASLLRTRGLMPVFSANCHDRWGPLAGSDAARAAAVNQAFADPAVKAILCARGGYGLSRILPRIDWKGVAANPKPLVGYSDLTPLLNYLPQHFGFPAFHGPMACDWQEAAGFNAMLDILTRGVDSCFDANVPVADVLTTGSVTAPVCGGNLAMIGSVIGTPYQIDMHGKIVLIEDVCEAPYRTDRVLRQLAMAGALDNIAGVIIGAFVDPEEASRPFMHDERATFAEYFANRNIPAVMNMPFGHMKGKRTLPIGMPLSLVVRPDHVSIAPG